MMKSFQRFIALLIMQISTLNIFRSFIFGDVLSFYNLFEIIKNKEVDAALLHNTSRFVLSIPANIISLIFYILMARELYLMYKFGRENKE